MARAARFALADARAMEQESMRSQLHGGAFYGAGMTLSESDSECDCPDSCSCREPCGGSRCGGNLASLVSRVGRFGSTISSGAAGIANAGSAAAATARAAALASARAAAAARTGALTAAPSSALVVLGSAGRPLATPRMPASFYQGLARPATGATGAVRSGTVAQKLTAMGVTPARVAQALAAGVAAGGLLAYFESMKSQQPGDMGNFDIFPPLGPATTPTFPPFTPPPGPSTLGPSIPAPGTGTGTGTGTGGPTVPGLPGKGKGRGTKAQRAQLAAILRSGNLPERYLVGTEADKLALAMSEGLIGSGIKVGGKTMRLPQPSASKPDGRSVRAQMVKEIMAKHGLSLPEASKYLKENGSK